jgi:C4-dicarboxylate transporter DctQ subunit
MWIYYLALPVGSALMLVRYIMRLVRFALFFDPAMTVGPVLHDEMPGGLSPPPTDR